MDGLVSYDSDGSENDTKSPLKAALNASSAGEYGGSPQSAEKLAAEWEAFNSLIGDEGKTKDTKETITSTLPEGLPTSIPDPLELIGGSVDSVKIATEKKKEESSESSSDDSSDEDDDSSDDSESGDDDSEDSSDDDDDDDEDDSSEEETDSSDSSEEEAEEEKEETKKKSKKRKNSDTEEVPGPKKKSRSKSPSPEKVIVAEKKPEDAQPAPAPTEPVSKDAKPTTTASSSHHRHRSSSRDRHRRRRSRSRGRHRRSASRERHRKSSRERRGGSRDRRESRSQRGRHSPSRSSRRERRSRSRDKHHHSSSRSSGSSRREHHRSGRRDRSHERLRSRSRERVPIPNFYKRGSHHMPKVVGIGSLKNKDRSRSRSPKKLTFKEQLRKQLMEVQKTAADGKLGEAGDTENNKVTPQQALLQTMAIMHQKAQEMTGVAVPKYYNPAAVNPLKYAEQVQKRKLLWSKKPSEDGSHPPAAGTSTETVPGTASEPNSTTTPASTMKTHHTTEEVWKATKFREHGTEEKFRKLMGIKDQPAEESGDKEKLTEEQMRRQDELFSQLDREYAMARMTTHTHRGIGLGFQSQGMPP